MKNNNAETNQQKQKTPTLSCIVTGKSRLTNQEYLDNKASAAGATVEEIVSHYVTREVLKNLRKGDLQGLRQEVATRILRLNGKQKGASKARKSSETAVAV